jgi:hypothetical protein
MISAPMEAMLISIWMVKGAPMRAAAKARFAIGATRTSVAAENT